jgi:hypothetical protein
LKSFGGGDGKPREDFFNINGPASPFGPSISRDTLRFSKQLAGPVERLLMAGFALVNPPLAAS